MTTVSVIIPTYNRRDLVRRAVKSVLAQTRPADEVLVVDDGSSDGTAETLRAEFGEAIHLIVQKNKGVSAARNAGVAASTGELLAFLDSDDYWAPGKLERQVPLMNQAGVVLSATNWAYETTPDIAAIDAPGLAGAHLHLETPLEFLLRPGGHKISLSTLIVRHDCCEKVGRFDECLRLAEDTKLYFRMAFEGAFSLLGSTETFRKEERPGENLTERGTSRYHHEVTGSLIEIFGETYFRATDQSPGIQKEIRGYLSHYLRNAAEHEYLCGNSWLARRRAVECMAISPSLGKMISAAILALSPSVGHWLLKVSGKSGAGTDIPVLR